MHELVIVEGILKAVLPEAKKHGACRITSIKLRVGELSGVVPACINEYFDIAAAGTAAEGAKIVIEKTPVTIACPDCGYNGIINRGRYRCPRCGGISFRILTGREYCVDSIEAQ